MVKLSTTGWLLILLYITSITVLEADDYSCCETIELKWSSAPHCNFSDLEPEPLGQYVEYGNCLGRPSYKRTWVPGPTHMSDKYLYYYNGHWCISGEPCQRWFHVMSKDRDRHCPREVTTWIGVWDHMGLVEGCFYTETPEGCHSEPQPFPTLEPRPSPESSHRYLYLLIPLGIISILAFIAFMYFKQKKRRRQQEEEEEEEEHRDGGHNKEQPAPPSYWQAVHM